DEGDLRRRVFRGVDTQQGRARGAGTWRRDGEFLSQKGVEQGTLACVGTTNERATSSARLGGLGRRPGRVFGRGVLGLSGHSRRSVVSLTQRCPQKKVLRWQSPPWCSG